MKLSENKLNECEKELNKMKDYFDVSLFENNATKLHKLKLEYNTICQILNNEDTTWFNNNNINKKSLNDLNMQLELNDDFVSNPKIQTSTPRIKNDALKYYKQTVEKIDKSVATFHENSTQTDVIIEESKEDEEAILNENKVEIVHVQFYDETKTVVSTQKAYRSLDSGISGDITISEQRSLTEDEIEKNKSEVSDQESTDEDYDENLLRKRLPELKGQTIDKRSTVIVTSSNTSTNEKNVQTTFVKKLFRFLILFLLFCTILVTFLYPLMKPTCGATRKEYFLKYIYMDEENFNKGPTAY